MDEWVADATELADRVATGELSGVELVEACLRRIEAVDPQLGAFVHVDADAALERARTARGPLAGVPVAVKDLAAFPGLRWAMGSRLFAGNVAAEHSPYTAALESAGLVTVGKTATSELGLLGSTETLLEGVTVNPWATGLSAAGSSGGSAAAVAAGLVPVAHASDGGGSIRVPASVCGLFGFKPSNGRCHSTLPSSAGFGALLVDHCVSRSVRDSALLLALTERTDAAAPFAPVGVIDATIDRRLRIAVWEPTLLGAAPTPEVSEALVGAAALCRDLGHEVAAINPPPVDGAAVSEAFFILAAASVDELAAAVAPALGRDVGPDELEPFTLELLDWYRGLSAQTRETAPTRLEEAAASYRSVFDAADAVLTPTLASPPWPLGEFAPNRAELVAKSEEIVGYTPIHNIAGCPAMSLPLTWSAQGLPIGIHVAAPPGADALLLGLAYELEAARPWRHRYPMSVHAVTS